MQTSSELSIHERIKSMPIFSILSDKAIAGLVASGTRETFRAGETVIEEGSEGNSLHLLLTGEAFVRKEIDVGHALTVGIIEPGGTFGEMSVFDQLPRSATVVASTDVSTFKLSRQAVDLLLVQAPDEAPQMLRHIITTLSERLRDARQELKLVYGISRSIGQVRTPGDLGDETLLRLIRDIPAATTGLMAAWPDYSDEATVVSAVNLDLPSVDGWSLHRQAPLVLELLQQRHPALLRPPEAAHPLHWMLPADRGGLLLAAMRVGDRLIGLLALGEAPEQRFTPAQAHLLATVANQVSVPFVHAMEEQDRTARERRSRKFYGRKW